MIEGLSEESLKLEQKTGYDSIPTIIRMYAEDVNGVLECVYPRCHFKRHDAEQMWFHVHAGKHGQSFGLTRNQIIEKVLSGEEIRPR